MARHNLIQILSDVEQSYRDFEGMADPTQLIPLCAAPKGPGKGQYWWDIYGRTPEHAKVIRSIVLNLLYETSDTNGLEGLTDEWAEGITYAVSELTTTQEWVVVTDDDWDAVIEQYQKR